MGFFSKIKKVWGKKDKEQKPAEAEAVEEAAAEAQAEEAIAGPSIAEEARTESDRTGEAITEPSPESPAEQESPAAPQPETLAETVADKAPAAATAPAAAEQRAEAREPWQQELVVSLRQAEPRLSAWLDLTLQGVETADETLWQRLAFLFQALEAPKAETDDFIARFRKWLDDMDYEYVDEFRSELQYRLALALDLEDEEDERSRLFLKLSEGLSKTKDSITKRIDSLVDSHSEIDESFWESLEEILITADVGFEATMKMTENLRERVRKAGAKDPAQFKDLMREELEEIFKPRPRITAVNPPEVIMMIGVNGVGKTTTIAKLAHRAQMQGRKVLIAAGDTFRAAAVEQLKVWSDRVGTGFHSKGEGADPAAVAYEAVDKAVREQYDLIFLDTAGRLHTKVDLMDELKKIKKVLGKRHQGAPHRSILVVDGTTGQNVLSQAKLFSEAVGVDEIIITKLDGTAKGGVIASIALQQGIPITFVGLGEKMEDLRPFSGKDFAAALLQ